MLAAKFSGLHVNPFATGSRLMSPHAIISYDDT